MKLPSEIDSYHKIRDAKILSFYIQGRTPKEIGERFKLGERRVQQIIYKHSDFVNPRIAWPKSKRIHLLQRALETEDVNGLKLSSKKDFLDITKELRSEIEGDKKSVEVNAPLQIFIKVGNGELENGSIGNNVRFTQKPIQSIQ